MKDKRLIVIGAGASGLMLSRELSKAGMKVILLEARDRIGGRIHTYRDSSFTTPVELGAEFIHGKLPVTLKLLKEYDITHSRISGEIWHARKGQLKKDKDFVLEHHRLLHAELKKLKKDMPVKKFLNKYFKEKEYASMKESVRGFVEGYESGDMDRFSTFAFRKDWLEAEDWDQYHVDGGYGKLMDAMAEECKKNGCRIHLAHPVIEIRWKKGQAVVVCEKRKVFTASRVVLTVPLGVLQEEKIKFSPALPGKIKRFRRLGYGHVIKVLFLFNDRFWQNKRIHQRLGKNLNKLFFIFSEALVPTWWTQYPSPTPLLTGWLSGSQAKAKMFNTDQELFEEALYSLSLIFEMEESILKLKLKAWKVVNWSRDEYARGSYAYATVNAEKIIKELEKPVKNTIFFSGEVFSKGGGTVEDALASGAGTAEKIMIATR
jgi:monoamine oxidase